MKKLIFGLGLALANFSNLYALNFKVPKSLQDFKPTNQIKNPKMETCEDFTGMWYGQCQYFENSETTQFSMRLNIYMPSKPGGHECENFDINGDWISIRNLSSQRDNHNVSSSLTYWIVDNDNPQHGKKLRSIEQRFSFSELNGGTFAGTMNSSQLMELDGNRLKLEAQNEYADFKGEAINKKLVKFGCVLDKTSTNE